jgi:hypothetical protein
MNVGSTHINKLHKFQRVAPRWEVAMGQLVLAFWLILVFANIKIDTLVELQSNSVLKGLSGLFLFLGLTVQASLSIRRIRSAVDSRWHLRKTIIHKRIGNYLPIALVLHASGFGYGLNLLLSGTLLLNMMQGWWGTQGKGTWYIRAVGVHIVLGILLYGLSIYHAVIALIFHSSNSS